jgi:hypothetical protein
MFTNALKISFLSILSIFLISCALSKRQSLPTYHETDLTNVLHSFDDIKEIETKFSATFERNDIDYKGDGKLIISQNGDLQLRIYLLGMLVFEMESNNGHISTKPLLEQNKSFFLANGLKDCIFWWDIKDYTINDDDGKYLIENNIKRLWLDKETMMPIKQIISIDDDLYLSITYDKPEKINDIWYPQKILLQLHDYKLTLTIKDILFRRSG